MNEPTNHKSNTTSSGEGSVSFNMNVPIWNRLNGNLLESNGWKRLGTEYQKENLKIKFDGVYWWLDGKRFQWIEELSEYLTNGKLPEE